MGARHTGADDACGVVEAVATEVGALMVRALLVMSCVAHLDDEDMGAAGGVEEAWATSRWWPPRADDVSHLMVHESMHGVVGNPVGDQCRVPRQSTSTRPPSPSLPPWQRRSLYPSATARSLGGTLPPSQQLSRGSSSLPLPLPATPRQGCPASSTGELLLGVGGSPSASSDGQRRLSAPHLLFLAMGLWEGSTVAGGSVLPSSGRGGGRQGRCPPLRWIQWEGRWRRPAGVPAVAMPSPPTGSSGRGAGGSPASLHPCDGGGGSASMATPSPSI
uniref:Uncharacterized protein n=1 Tax=Oryza punctata TaxID=4537 RepID=A0A0E0M893_ORYPU